MIFLDLDNTTIMMGQKEVYLLERKLEMENMEEETFLDLVNIILLKTKAKVFPLVSNIILGILTIFQDQELMILKLILYMSMHLPLVLEEGLKGKKELTYLDPEITILMSMQLKHVRLVLEWEVDLDKQLKLLMDQGQDNITQNLNVKEESRWVSNLKISH